MGVEKEILFKKDSKWVGLDQKPISKISCSSSTGLAVSACDWGLGSLSLMTRLNM
jgi:hypothetical protein